MPIGEIDWNREKYDISYVMKQKPVHVFHRLEDEMISEFMKDFRNMNYQKLVTNYPKIKITDNEYAELIEKLEGLC